MVHKYLVKEQVKKILNKYRLGYKSKKILPTKHQLPSLWSKLHLALLFFAYFLFLIARWEHQNSGIISTTKSFIWINLSQEIVWGRAAGLLEGAAEPWGSKPVRAWSVECPWGRRCSRCCWGPTRGGLTTQDRADSDPREPMFHHMWRNEGSQLKRAKRQRR